MRTANTWLVSSLMKIEGALHALLILLACQIASGGSASYMTNWSYISVDFENTWAHYLPSVPASPLNVTYDYIDASRGPFQSLSLSVDGLGDETSIGNVFCPNNETSSLWPRDAIRAGPELTCGKDVSCSGLSGRQCRATYNSGSIELGVKLGTHWARASAHPSYVMYRFPAVPNAQSVAVRYELDGRYGSELYGANPCANASSSNPKFAGYVCSLCVDEDNGSWDRTIGAGFFVLWSASGRDVWEITGPVVPYDMNSDSATYGVLNSPDSLDLQEGEELVVVFVVTTQYPGWIEAPSHVGTSASATPWGTYKCSVSTASSAVRDKPLMLKTVTVFSRGGFSLPVTPDMPPGGGAANVSVPRLGGTNSDWFNATIEPWLDLPCDFDASARAHGGWPGGRGVVEFKSLFEDQALGFRSCDGESALDFNNIEEHWAAAIYLNGEGLNSYKRESALHLLRRLDACHRGHVLYSGGEGSLKGSQRCQFNESETERLRMAVLQRELIDDWGDLSVGENGVWYWEYPWLSAGGYDLVTSETIGYWASFVDIFRPYMSASNLTHVASKMEERIDFFLDIFYGGSWALWNGNNWTPYLSVGAVKWAIVFWHEEPAKAKEVLRAVYDVLWLHCSQYIKETYIHAPSFYTPMTAPSIEASVYAEGVAVYSYMSTQSLLKIAALTRGSFGGVPPAIESIAELIEKVPAWSIRTQASDAMLVPFGDSHRSRGFGSTAILHALLAREVLFNNTVKDANTAVGGSTCCNNLYEANERHARSKAMTLRLKVESTCLVKRWMSGAYHQSYNSPDDFPPELAKNWTDIVASCRNSNSDVSVGSVLSQPLGGFEDIVLESGGYAALRTPLLPLNSSAYTKNAVGEICFQPGTTDTSGDTAGCLSGDSAALTLSANSPYSVLALEAKSSSSPHSEVDFGTFVWTAWGTRLVSEHGYGTIATSVATTDTRRFEDVDNNPAGHNTLVIRQAASSGAVGAATEGSFSQFNNIPGTVSFVASKNENWNGMILGRPCVDLNGSAPYGSERNDGWLDAFHRFACPLPGGHFFLIDTMAIKANRSSLSLSGGSYGGTPFEESTPAHELDLATYFHTDVETELNDDGAESAFEFPSNGWCAHVDVNLTSSAEREFFGNYELNSDSDSSALGDLALLHPRCGIGRSRASDAIGAIAGWSSSGGNWTGGNLVQGESTSGQPTYLRRMVWEGGHPLTPASSQVRAFVLAAAAAPGTSVAEVRTAMATAADSFNEDIEFSASVASDDTLLEMSSATDKDSGAPLAWARACPPPADEDTLRQFGGCCGGLPESFAPLAAASAPQGSQSGAPECACVEACAGGRLFWATLNGSFSHPQHLSLAQVRWAGECNASHAMRRHSLRVADSSSSSTGPTPRPTLPPTPLPSMPTRTPTKQPTLVPSFEPTQSVGVWAAVSSAIVLTGFPNASAFYSAGGASVVSGALGTVLSSALDLPVNEAQAALSNITISAYTAARRRAILASSFMVSFVCTLEINSLGLADASSFLAVITTAITEGAADGTLASAIKDESNGTKLAVVALEVESSITTVTSKSSVSVLAAVTRRPSFQPSFLPPTLDTLHPTTPLSAPSASRTVVSSPRGSAAGVPPVLIWALTGTGALVLVVGLAKLIQNRCNSKIQDLDAATFDSMESEGKSPSCPGVKKTAASETPSLLLTRLPANAPLSERPARSSSGSSF